MRTLSFLLIACWMGWASAGLCDDASTSVDRLATGEYVFVVGDSVVTQTGGLAGVERTYRVQGRFLLRVDDQAGTATFVSVDARLLPRTDAWPWTLDDVFSLTDLSGVILDDGSIRFTGKARDGSDIAVSLVVEKGSVQLKGETIPPPDSADFFVFALNATACRETSLPPARPRSGRYVFAPGRSTVTRTGGIAGITKVYQVKGGFRLHVAHATGTASFVRGNARLIDPSGLEPTRRLEEVFNLTGLAGTVGDDASIRFTGRTHDGSDVEIVLVFTNRRVQLTGATTPPPDSADFFIFTLDAMARRR